MVNTQFSPKVSALIIFALAIISWGIGFASVRANQIANQITSGYEL